MTAYRDQVKAAQARRQRFQQLKSQVTPATAANLRGLARENPSLSPGALYGAAAGGVQPGTAASRALGEGDLKVKKDSGNFFQRAITKAYKGVKVVGGAILPDEVGQAARGVGGVLKGVSRGADIGLSSVGQAAQGTVRAAYADGFQLSDIRAGMEQTDLFNASREVIESGGYAGLFTGETDVDFGSGFFAGGDVTRRRRAMELRESGTRRIGGSTATTGRVFANSIGLEPGTTAFSLVSGFPDLVVSLGLDPTSYTPAAVTKPLQARRLFAGDASKGFDAEAAGRRVDEGLAVAKAERFGNTPRVAPQPRDGYKLFRRDVQDSNLDPEVRPQGTYYSLVESDDFVSPFEAEDVILRGGDPSSVRDFTAKGSKVGVLELEQQTLKHARFDGIYRGFEGKADTGVSALKTLLKPDEFERLRTMKKADLIAELEKRAPSFDWSKVHADQDAYDVLSAYGAVVAREKGYKALLLRDPEDPNFNEFVALKRDALIEDPPDREAMLAEIGAVDGIRKTVNSDRVLEWLTAKKEGQQVVAYLAKETDFGKLYDATKGKIDPTLLAKIAEREMTGDEVITMIGPILGRTARTDEKFGLDAVAKADLGTGNLGTLAHAKFKQRIRDTRIFGTVPERVLRKDDLNETLKVADAFMRNALFDAKDRSEILRRYAVSNGDETMFTVTKDMMSIGARKAMAEYGIDKNRAQQLFRIYEDSSSGRRAWWKEQVVVNGEKLYRNRAFNVTDEILDDGSVRALPHLASQFLDNNIPLPDPREIRAEMSRFRNVLSLPGVQPSKMAMEKISDNLFKPLVLLRPAYVLRNQIDEQFRPAGVGLNSLMSHPVQYLQWLLSDQQSMGRMLSKVGFTSRGATFGPEGTMFDETGEAIRRAREVYKDAQRAGDKDAIADAKAAYETAKNARQSITPFTEGVSAFERTVTGGLGNWRNRSYAQVNGDELFQKSDPDYARAAGEALHRIHNDPIARRIAAGEDIDKIKADWWRGPLQGFRGDLAKRGPRMEHLNDPIGAEQYIDDTVEFVKTFVGDSSELRQAAATGKINGVPLTNGDTLQISKRALDEFDALKQNPAFRGPDAMIGSSALRAGEEQVGGWTKAVDALFYQLADRPTRYLSKSPVFRQRYYRRMENLVGFMAPEAADDLIKAAQVANLRGKDIARLQAKRRPTGTMTFEEADLVAKTDALEFTNNLFYSLHHRGQFFDVTRLLFPFGEAFLDSARKYSQLTAKRPELPYRLQQVIEGGRNADLNGDGEGFFYTDEQTGEEMVAFPGSDKFLDLVGLEGAGKFRAPVANLNILGTTVIPGFGPAVQVGAANMLPNDDDFNGVRELISPYGDRTLEGGVLESFFPAWFKKVTTSGVLGDQLQTPAQQAAFAQAQKDMMGYLASTGEYDLQSEAGIQKLMDDSKGKTRGLFVIRALAQAIAPSPPSPEFVAYDKDGTLLTQFKLAEEYRRIFTEQKELGTPESANRIFIETFGPDAVLAAIPNTKAAKNKSPINPNRKALEFYQQNRAAAERFPSVFGMFSPDGEDEEFDFVAYQQQINRGERVAIEPDEAVQMANQRVARMIYDNAKSIVGEKPTKEQKSQLRDLKAKLAEDFPGYSNSFTNDTPALLEDLKRAAKDPVLGKTEAGQGLNIYLQARDLMEQTAREQFGPDAGWARAGRTRHLRDAMRVLADRLSNDFPGFGNIYDRALEREMARD